MKALLRLADHEKAIEQLETLAIEDAKLHEPVVLDPAPSAGGDVHRQLVRSFSTTRGSGSTPRPGPCGTAMRPFLPGWIASPSGFSAKSQ